MRFYVRVLACCLGAGVIAACARSAPPAPPSASEVSVSQPAVSPFSLEVVEDVNDGSQLHVHGRIEAETSWPVSDVVVRVSGSKAGESDTLRFYRLPDLLQGADISESSLLTPGKPWDFYLSVPSNELSDYQLELLWGKEARAAVETHHRGEQPQQGLVLRDLKIQRIVRSCPHEPCAATFRISAMLFNASAAIVESARLGVGFVWVPRGAALDFNSQIPEDEENVDVTGLQLQAQQARPLDLELDQTVPGTEGGEFVPSVRILSYR